MNGLEAVKSRKENPYATWGERGEENRIEPVTKPAFDVPFRLIPGESIFTIGSCFARNVETELQARGFKVPIRDLFKTRGFKQHDLSIVNNFGTPSIFNELSWALGGETFDEELGFIELAKDKWIDLHLIAGIKPAPLKTVKLRRKALEKSIRSIRDCRVVVMTLGLVELWWDNEYNRYLNSAPLPLVLKRWPGRFELHVLSYEECYTYLRDALNLIFNYCGDDTRLILTVSPVPMMVTHRHSDVIVANSYSKSVLRAVAEQIVTEFDQASYFPSYESVTHSERRLAWMSDMVHVTKEIVAFNVERMVDAFSDQAGSADMLMSDESSNVESDPEVVMLVERGRKARENGEFQFFDEQGHWSAKSQAFAIEHAQALQSQDRLDEAAEVLSQWSGLFAKIALAEIHCDRADYEAAIATITPVCNRTTRGNNHWKILLRASGGLHGVKGVLEAEKKWINTFPRRQGIARLQCARALNKLREFDLAIERLEVVLADFDTANMSATLFLSRLYMSTRQPAKALALLTDLDSLDSDEIMQVERVRAQARSLLADDDQTSPETNPGSFLSRLGRRIPALGNLRRK
jgi:tetratricopeptide (TPR) repeat protein